MGHSLTTQVLDQNITVLTLNVATHELYGHGSGDLLKKEAVVGQKVPDLLYPGKFVSTYYEEGETYQSVFG